MFGAASLIIYFHFITVFVFIFAGYNSSSPIEIYQVPMYLAENEEAKQFVQLLNNLCFFTILYAFPIVILNYFLFKNDQTLREKFRLHNALLVALLSLIVFLSASDLYMGMENVFSPDWNRKNLPLLIVTSFPGLIIVFIFHSIKKLTL